MATIKKHAEFLDTLRTMVQKEASAGVATGKPGADTHYTSVSEKTEHVNKNEEGHPEHNPQEFKQEPSKDPSDPTKHGKKAEEATEPAKEAAATTEEPAKTAEATKEAGALAGTAQVPNTNKPKAAQDAVNTVSQKKAEDDTANLKLAELGQQLLTAIKAAEAAELEKEAKSKGGEKPVATGKPGADTHYTSVSVKTEHVNKNEQGHPEDNPQEFKQEKSKDPSDPTKHGKKAEETVSQEEIDKQAAFELGRQFCRSFLQTKVATQQQVYKEAGRKDFETLIAQAAAELENQKVANTQKTASYDESYAEKQAEEAGAQAFYALMKQAQTEYQTDQVKQAFEQKVKSLEAEKLAAEKKAADLASLLAEKDAAMQKKAEEEKRAQEFHTWGNYIVNEVIDRLKNEPVR